MKSLLSDRFWITRRGVIGRAKDLVADISEQRIGTQIKNSLYLVVVLYAHQKPDASGKTRTPKSNIPASFLKEKTFDLTPDLWYSLNDLSYRNFQKTRFCCLNKKRRGTMATYYEILGVDENASTDEITIAYVAKFVKRTGEKPRLEKKLDKEHYLATEACAVLTDPEKRREYDKALKEGKAPEPGAVLKTRDTEKILRTSMGKQFDKMFDKNTLKVFRERAAKKKSGELQKEWASQSRKKWLAISVVSVVCLFIFSLAGFKIGRVKGLFIGLVFGGFLSWFLGKKIDEAFIRSDPLMRGLFKMIH